MRRLIDFKNVKQRSRPILEIIPMVFDNNHATQRLVLHYLKHVIHRHRDELQKLADRKKSSCSSIGVNAFSHFYSLHQYIFKFSAILIMKHLH